MNHYSITTKDIWIRPLIYLFSFFFGTSGCIWPHYLTDRLTDHYYLSTIISFVLLAFSLFFLSLSTFLSLAVKIFVQLRMRKKWSHHIIWHQRWDLKELCCHKFGLTVTLIRRYYILSNKIYQDIHSIFQKNWILKPLSFFFYQ